MPESIDRRVTSGPVLPPVVDRGAPATVTPDAPKPPQAVDGVDAPKTGEAAESPRKTLSQRLGTMGKRILKGAAILGLGVGLVVGGSVFMQMQEHRPVEPAVQIEAPAEVNTDGLPQGRAPPSGDAKPQSTTPAELPTAPGTLPTAPAQDPTTDPAKPLQPQLYSPQTIRLDGVLGR